GLELTLEGTITSIPYINMTLALLEEIGVETSFVENTISVKPSTIHYQPKTLVVESDWSSASYYFSIVALCDVDTEITLSSYKENSLQGDSVLVDIYKHFGVVSTFNGNELTLRKEAFNFQPLTLNLQNAPDIAQTIAVTCFGLGVACDLTGLHTLIIKETDRLVALKTEIEKLGGTVEITDTSLHLSPSTKIKKNIRFGTYHNHRVAMAFAPLALKTYLIIEDANVVSKSYPTLWEDLESLGFKITK